MLKAKISQVKSNLYAVKTTKYDTTDIELIVETADSSPWLNPRFELLGIKSDGHEVHQTENFKVIDLNNHIVQVTLDEQFVTCEGNVDLQLLIKDGSRKSSTPFKLHVGRSLDSDILESHRNVKVLDELEKYIIEGREYISEATELAQDTANYIQAVNTQAEANEAQRLQNESQRQSAETKRKEAEDGRKQAEVLRVQNEDTRQSTEVIRIANEQARLENESNRIDRENSRENKESIRQAQEQKRHTSESTRQSQEDNRQSNEDNRKQAEKSRNQEETTRINNEATRKQAEDTRNSQELDRQSAESTRQTSETNRNNAESIRTQNENTRQSQETSRITNEQARVQQEQERVSNENTRKTEEAKRVEAEELRKEAYAEATQLLEELRNFEPITEDDRTDYMGNQHESLKAKNDADVDWLLREINTVHYDGQHITATDTIEGRSKSAILKGNTLVNLSKFDKNIEKTSSGSSQSISLSNVDLMKTNTTYTFIYWIESMSGTTVSNITTLDGNANTQMFDRLVLMSSRELPTSFVLKFTQTSREYTGVYGLKFSSLNGAIKLIKSVILEGDYTNADIPYFEGMQSVKLPVLKTANTDQLSTIPFSFFESPAQNKTGWCSFVFDEGFNGKIRVKLMPAVSRGFRFVCFASEEMIYSNKDVMNGIDIEVENASYIGFHDFDSGIQQTAKGKLLQFIKDGDLQITLQEKGKPAVYTYKDIDKTNILSTSEDVELRGIGDVRDELDLLTGEVTEHIGEIVLDGSESWSAQNKDDVSTAYKCVAFRDLFANSVSSSFIFSNIPYSPNSYAIGTSEGWCIDANKDIWIRKLNSAIGGSTSNDFKTWLSQNPITVQYQRSTESIKTVDLSDNHVYSYKGTTYYDCSSAEGSLVPTLSIDVPTNLPAVVTRQRETIREQENQIKLLEETNSELIISQETQDEEIVTSMLASVELFEMVLSMTPLSIDMSKSMEVNPMVEVYVTLILKGEKTIEQVPAIIRDKVQAQLDLLTK